MAVPMRETSSGQGTQPAQTTTAANFVEYDDNEWDVGIGDLIIDLDADIEKTGVGDGSGGGGGMAAPKPAQAKMHSPAVEHQATVDKGLKMKIKRTKPGTKHEIVKSGENGERQTGGHGGAKRGSSSHRREKKHSGSGTGNEKSVTSGTSTASGNANNNGKENVNGLVRVVTYPVSGSTQQQSVPAVQATDQSHQLLQQPQAQPKKSKSTGVVASGGGTNSGPHGAPSGGGPVTPSSSTTAAGVTTPLGPPPLLVGAVVPSSPPPPLHPAAPGLTPVQTVQTGQSVGAQVATTTGATSLVTGQAQSPQPDTGGPPPTLPLQSKELVDVCVGTSVGTITEPDCLGPCEPGTSVTLEGIVWHETEGVLVVNVTWRGKTYVGTLLDCTRHDWAPPRFCDSPTSDMDARTPKGRGKRGRSAANAGASDLSNFTETRSSVHSKLRSQNTAGGKGRRGPGAGSPTPFATPKVESSQGKRKSKNHEEEPNPKRKVANTGSSASTAPQISVPPTPAPAAPQTAQSTSPLPPPALLECPEPNCSKKYKHINGLKYHQSHAHGSPDDEDTKESVTSEEEEPAEAKKEEPPEIAPSIIPVATPVPQPVVHEEQEPPEEEMTIRVPTPPSPIIQEEPTPQPPVLTKVPQFKVKPASALMPEEKKPVPQSPTKTQPQTHKKKNRKSPSASPHPTPLEPPALGLETSRDDVQSPAYSDISDDAAPLLEAEVEGKPKTADKKESGQSPQLQHYGIYPYYGQPPYLVPSVSEKPKESPEKTEKPLDKEKKEGEYPQQKLLSQHYYQYGYHVPGYPYNMEGYPVVIDEKKDEKSQPEKPALHIPNPPKPKTETITPKEKHQNENHQILKESIEMKNQVNPAFLYQRQNNQQGQEDMRRFYIYPERKEAKATPPPQKTHPSPSPKHKEKEEKKEEKKQQEGVKPTMETQGPPPPPTSQYAYIHPGYMQSPHYGPLPFDHSMYRGMNPMLVSGYANTPYLHPQLHAVPRYGPEDLSRGQSGKALDLLQHHASQYYPHPSHKIHELQERAIKSPTPKSANQTGTSPTTALQVAGTGGAAGGVTVGPGGSVVPVTSAPAIQQAQGKTAAVADQKDTRSPPPQRHVHTHHHTHVGLGYPILAGQYPTPYGDFFRVCLKILPCTSCEAMLVRMLTQQQLWKILSINAVFALNTSFTQHPIIFRYCAGKIFSCSAGYGTCGRSYIRALSGQINSLFCIDKNQLGIFFSIFSSSIIFYSHLMINFYYNNLLFTL